jgi:uncharacterized protein DUF664
MTVSEILIDAFGRVRDEVEAVLDGIDADALQWRPDVESNSIAWLVWHLTRIQDDHLAGAFETTQVWHSQGWVERFGLPFPPDSTGYGHSSDEVAAVRASASLLRDYYNAVADRTADLLAALSESELGRVVDRRWNPPVTLAVRLVSVIADDLQHVGQAAYLRGLAERAGTGQS